MDLHGEKPLSPEKLQEIQAEILKKRAEILQELDDEWTRKNIGDKLNSIYEELEEINRNLNSYYRNGAAGATGVPAATRRIRKAGPLDPSTVRQVEHPIFKQLGIKAPPGQRRGDELVPIGQKVKKNRKSRRATRYSRRSRRAQK